MKECPYTALEIALGLRPRAISLASGCKIPALGKSLGPRGVYFPIHPSARQCTDTVLPPFPAVYSSVVDFRTWIDETIEKNGGATFCD